MTILQTARLTLRPQVQADAAPLFNILNDPEAMRFWSRPPLARLAVAEDLVREQQAVMSDALDHGRDVYLLLITPTQLDDFKHTFITPPFRATEIDHWTEPAGNPADPPPDRPLSPPSWRLNLIIPWAPQTRHLLRVTRETPTTRPAAAVSSSSASGT